MLSPLDSVGLVSLSEELEPVVTVSLCEGVGDAIFFLGEFLIFVLKVTQPIKKERKKHFNTRFFGIRLKQKSYKLWKQSN